jgi:hypothetical protein
MLHELMGRAKCVFGHHERSRAKVRLGDLVDTSVCRYCTIPMQRGRKARWSVARDYD